MKKMNIKRTVYSILALLGCCCQHVIANTSVPASDSITVTTAGLADNLIEYAMRYRGTPYRLGGKGPRVFDCSGFTRFVYDKFGIALSVNSTMQAKEGRPVEGSISNLQKGDILIFGSRKNTRRVGHVGLYIAPDSTGEGFTFIHAATHGGVQISNIKEAYYSKRFLGARRVLPDFYVVQADTVDTELLSAENDLYVEVRDTLALGDDDARIVLLADGSWAYVLPDGMVKKAEGTEILVLAPDGHWRAVPVQTHVIPSLEPKPAAAASASAAASDDLSEAEYYTIKSGDTLSGIAVKCHTTVNTLCRLNGITTKTVLRIGRRLRVK